MLGDWVEGTSDVDFIGLLASAADQSSIEALGAVHARLPMTDGIYVTAEQLRTPPAEAGQAPRAREGRVWVSRRPHDSGVVALACVERSCAARS